MFFLNLNEFEFFVQECDKFYISKCTYETDLHSLYGIKFAQFERYYSDNGRD